MDTLGIGTECQHCHEWVRPEFSGQALIKKASVSESVVCPGMLIVGVQSSEPIYLCPICRNRIHVA